MDTLITNHSTGDHGAYVSAICGKTEATVSTFSNPKSQTFIVTVCCKNAAHKVFRGFGRMFDSFDDALEGYRSAEMKAIILAARDLIAGQVSFDHTPSNILQFSNH